MRNPASLVSFVRGAAVASVGCLLMVGPIAFAQTRAATEAHDTKIGPAARPGAAPSREPTMAPAPTRPAMKKTRDTMRRIEEPTAAPAEAERGLQRVAPTGIQTPKRGMAPAGITPTDPSGPANDMRMKQAAQRFEAEARRIADQVASEKRRFASQQQSELERENEKTLAKIRQFSKDQGRTDQIRAQAAKLMKDAETASPSEAQAIDEQAAKLLREIEGR